MFPIVNDHFCATALLYLVEKTTIFIVKVYFIAIVCSLSLCAEVELIFESGQDSNGRTYPTMVKERNEQCFKSPSRVPAMAVNLRFGRHETLNRNSSGQ